jgi:hypothetical protein
LNTPMSCVEQLEKKRPYNGMFQCSRVTIDSP